jgi:hypothetical protein
MGLIPLLITVINDTQELIPLFSSLIHGFHVLILSNATIHNPVHTPTSESPY